MADRGAVAVARSARMRTRHRIAAALPDAVPAVPAVSRIVESGAAVAAGDVRVRPSAVPMCG